MWKQNATPPRPLPRYGLERENLHFIIYARNAPRLYLNNGRTGRILLVSPGRHTYFTGSFLDPLGSLTIAVLDFISAPPGQRSSGIGGN